jgi:hypothetical protein
MCLNATSFFIDDDNTPNFSLFSIIFKLSGNYRQPLYTSEPKIGLVGLHIVDTVSFVWVNKRHWTISPKHQVFILINDSVVLVSSVCHGLYCVFIRCEKNSRQHISRVYNNNNNNNNNEYTPVICVVVRSSHSHLMKTRRVVKIQVHQQRFHLSSIVCYEWWTRQSTKTQLARHFPPTL